MDEAVHKILKDLKITFYESCYFKAWSVSLDNIVTQLELISYDKVIKVDCAAVFYYGSQGVDLSAFSGTYVPMDLQYWAGKAYVYFN